MKVPKYRKTISGSGQVFYERFSEYYNQYIGWNMDKGHEEEILSRNEMVEMDEKH